MLKFILLLVIVSTFQVFSKGYSQSKINVSFHNVTLKTAFKEIEKKSDYKFLYNDNVLNKNNLSISLDATDASLDDAMTTVLAKTNLDYKLSDNNLVILYEKGTLDLLLKVTGYVTDENNTPLPGVSIKVKGTNIGAQTTIDGKYVLNIPDANAKNVVLVFSFVGYSTQEIPLNSNTTLNVQLKSTPSSLNEVVVVGYGTQKKVDLTGAVAVVPGNVLNERVVTDPLTLLQGQAPGLNVVQTSGEPGNNGNTLRIRGYATFQANADPLVVVDGIPLPGIGNIEELNPNDIESISVLKDAASASIYGSRGANGVILVTTKKGSTDGKVHLEYDYNAGLTSATALLDLVSNSVEYMQMFNTAAAHVGNVTRYSDAFIAQYSPGGIYANINVNWQDMIFSRVVTQNHYLSLNGTTGATKYNVALGYIDEPGIMMGLSFKKYTLQLGLNSTVNKTINMGINVNMNYGDRRAPGQGSTDEYVSTVTQPPFWGPFTLDGSGNFTDTNNSDPTGNFHNKNYFAVDKYEIAAFKSYNAIAKHVY